MRGIFRGATAFNSDLHSWNTSAVTYMDGIFFDAPAFNSDLSTWRATMIRAGDAVEQEYSIDSATAFNRDPDSCIQSMFIGATAFNRERKKR